VKETKLSQELSIRLYQVDLTINPQLNENIWVFLRNLPLEWGSK